MKLRFLVDKNGGDESFLAKFGVWEGSWRGNKEDAIESLLELLVHDYNKVNKHIKKMDKAIEKLDIFYRKN